jgi:hypothetical protein
VNSSVSSSAGFVAGTIFSWVVLFEVVEALLAVESTLSLPSVGPLVVTFLSIERQSVMINQPADQPTGHPVTRSPGHPVACRYIVSLLAIVFMNENNIRSESIPSVMTFAVVAWVVVSIASIVSFPNIVPLVVTFEPVTLI